MTQTETQTKPKKKKIKQHYNKKEVLMGYLFASPWILGFLLLQTFPLFYSLYLSFTNATTTSMTVSFRGLDNYKAILGDPLFWNSAAQHFEVCTFKRTVKSAVCSVSGIASACQGTRQKAVSGTVLHSYAGNHCGCRISVETAAWFHRRG